MQGFDREITAHLAALVAAPNKPATVPVKMPFTCEVLGYLPAAGEHDVELAVNPRAQRKAGWESMSFQERARIFLRFHDLLLERLNEILDLIQLETGKARPINGY